MHHRFLTWLFVGALLGVISVRAQAPATTAAAIGDGKFDQEGLVLVAKVSGNVSMVLNGATTALKVNDKVPQKAKIITANNASVVLVFSNGATTQLGTDTELVIDEYLQDPFADTIKVAELSDEPSPSRTKLSLNRGELVGNVKKLKYERGSSFRVQTPVGAAGIRGTTFRIVFRPSGTGQAFFTLSTASGIVAFEPPNVGGGITTGNAGTLPSTPAPADGTPTQPANTPQSTVTGSGSAAVSIPQGQELVIVDVQVTTNAQGQMVVTVLPPSPSSTTGISSANMQAVAQVASDIAVAVQQTVFTPPPPAPTPGNTAPSTGTNPTGTTTGSTTGSTTGTTEGQSQTSNISGSNFTGQVTTTPPAPPTPPPAVRQSTITTEP